MIAVSAVGLPLIIHLLNLRRPRKVQFSTLSFFKELQKTTIRKIRVKRYLLLLFRLLAVACLAFVLSRPFLPPGFGGSGNSLAPALNTILIDNSISMSRIGQNGPLLEQAKEIVKSIEATSKDSDRFILQVTNGESQYSTILGHSQLLRKLEELTFTSSGNYGTKRIAGLVEILEDVPYENKRLFVITDGQRSQFLEDNTIENIPKTITATFINLGEVEVQNTVVVNLESSTNMIGVGLPVNLAVTIQNKSEVPVANQFLSLEVEGELVGQYSVSLPAGAQEVYAFEVSPSKVGSSNGKVIIEGDEFTLDNEIYFTIEVPESRDILWVKEDDNTEFNSYTGVVLEASGSNDSQLSYTESGVEILGTSNLRNYDAIILDGLRVVPDFAFENLLDFVQSGKGVVFFPSETGDLRNYNSFLSQYNVGSFEGIQGEYAAFNSISKGSVLQEDHPIFAGLFEQETSEELRIANPDVYYYYKLKPSTSPGGFNIISMNNSDPLIREKRFGEGRLLVSATGSDLGWSNFPVKPLFAPFFYRTFLYASSSDEGGFVEHKLGDVFEWIGNTNMEETELDVEGNVVFPEATVTPSGVRVNHPAEDWVPGWVTIKDSERAYSIAVNMEREESEFVQFNKDERESIANGMTFVDAFGLNNESLQNEIKASGLGREIWSWFMMAGIVFLVIESLISIFYKAETIS